MATPTSSSSPSAPADRVTPQRFVALLVATLVSGGLVWLFLGMVPPAAAREVKAACAGLRTEATNKALGPLPVAAPDFTVTRVDGTEVKLSSFRGKVVVVNFWEASCKTCAQEKPGLFAMAADKVGSDLAVLALAGNNAWSDIAHLFPKGAPFEVFLDKPGEDTIGPIARAWGVTGWPETFIIDRQGLIRFHMVSYRDWDSSIADTCLQSLVDQP